MSENKGKILVVDKDGDTCEMMEFLLNLAGYEVRTATSISTSLDIIREQEFDLILLGWFFEDGTGLELCQLIRNFDTHTPIFFCSGNAYQSGIEKARRAGAQEYFIKPFDHLQLVKSIDHQLYGA